MSRLVAAVSRSLAAVGGKNGKFLKNNHGFFIHNFSVQHIPIPFLHGYISSYLGSCLRNAHSSTCSPLSFVIYEPKVANKVLLLEAVPPNLTDHGIEARVEAPYLALVHLKHHPKGSEVGWYGVLATAQACTWHTIRCAVNALTVGITTSQVVAHVPLVAADEP
uniref:Uncharacterized protein n=1 Tax=Oryza glumipatula TaxID=40148 RepID=A0A0E0BV87_9ORYZ